MIKRLKLQPKIPPGRPQGHLGSQISPQGAPGGALGPNFHPRAPPGAPWGQLHCPQVLQTFARFYNLAFEDREWAQVWISTIKKWEIYRKNYLFLSYRVCPKEYAENLKNIEQCLGWKIYISRYIKFLEIEDIQLSTSFTILRKNVITMAKLKILFHSSSPLLNFKPYNSFLV